MTSARADTTDVVFQMQWYGTLSHGSEPYAPPAIALLHWIGQGRHELPS